MAIPLWIKVNPMLLRTTLACRLLPLIVLASLMYYSAAVHAQADRYVDGATGNDAGNNCASQANPCATIGHALDQASADDTIAIAAGTYTEALVIERNVALAGSAADEVIIQANDEPGVVNQRVFFVESGNRLELRDLTVRHGAALSGAGAGRLGGAVYVDAAQLEMTRVVVTLNQAANQGGAIYNAEGSVILTEVELSHNSSGPGGAIRNDDGSLTMMQVDFHHNQGGFGGALNNVNGGTVVGVNVMFRGNEGARGGGFYTSGSDSTVELINVAFTGNYASEFGNLGGSPVLANVVFSANRTANDGQGGGFHNQGSSAAATFANSIFWNNQDETGTGTRQASVFKSATSDLFFTHSLVQGCLPVGESWDDDCGDDLGGNLTDQNPQFTSPISPGSAPNAGGYFRQQQNSPVINQGDNGFITGVATDLDGFIRIVDGTVDLGPYEFGSDVFLFRDRFER
jgi:predicted outer membrane repeat protein